jgi:Lytic polysaccharide mono-oxygenase, cellulose-degrading
MISFSQVICSSRKQTSSLKGLNFTACVANMIPVLTLNTVYLCIVILLPVLIDQTNGHGRFIQPPSRASAWRYGFPTPPDYDDTASFCGGKARQWKTNGGKCGECGDAFDLKKPRPHEYGGEYGKGVITGKYKQASVITMRVQLTAYHMGQV